MEVVNHIIEEILNMVFDHNIAEHNVPPPPPPPPPPAPLPFNPVLALPFLHPNGADSDSDYLTDSDATLPFSPIDFYEDDILWQ